MHQPMMQKSFQMLLIIYWYILGVVILLGTYCQGQKNKITYINMIVMMGKAVGVLIICLLEHTHKVMITQ